MQNIPGKVKLLVVEDSPADVFLVKEAMNLEGLSFQIEVLDDGEAAIQALNRVDDCCDTPPSAVLVDLNIPRKDGIQVLDRLRESPRCGAIPAIVFSSSDSPADRQRALSHGASEYFRKPSGLDEFMQLGPMMRRLLSPARTTAA